MDAFKDDPLTNWLYPQGGESARPWFRVALRAGLKRGHTYKSDDGTGAAIWAPPSIGHLDRHEGGELTQAMAEHYGAAGVARLAAVAEATAAAHPPAPHFYLFVIGVSGRSRGVGATLLEPVLRICDEQSWPAYLESSNPRNESFYRRLGFSARYEILPEGGPPLLGMWREPLG